MWKKIAERGRKVREFGFFLVLEEQLHRFTGRSGKLHDLLERVINRKKLKIIEQEGTEIFARWREASFDGAVLEKDAPLWIFWWQGMEKAPDLVQACVKSIAVWAGEHPVHLLTRENLADYLCLPPYLYQRLEKKRIGYAHFSDVVRVALLYEYGGIWCDATLFAAGDFLKEAEGKPLYSCKQRNGGRFLAAGRWATFFWAGGKKNPVFGVCRDFLYAYWERHTVVLDYLMPDYILDAACRKVPLVEQMIHNIPYNNEDLYWLRQHLNQCWQEEEFRKVTANTLLFKLTYKSSCREEKDGRPTYYGKLISDSAQKITGETVLTD